MRSFAHVIMDKEGLHARSCVILVHEASKWKSRIEVSCGNREADAKRMASLLELRADKGDSLVVSCEGVDESDASQAMQALMRMSI